MFLSFLYLLKTLTTGKEKSTIIIELTTIKANLEVNPGLPFPIISFHVEQSFKINKKGYEENTLHHQ